MGKGLGGPKSQGNSRWCWEVGPILATDSRALSFCNFVGVASNGVCVSTMLEIEMLLYCSVCNSNSLLMVHPME